MGKNFTSVFAVCLAISAIPLACGGDDDDGGGDGDDGKGGKGGSSGAGMTGGSSGNAGRGGTSGQGGTGGRGGSAGSGGRGGTAGTGGTMGGEGGFGGAEGGMGGEGGGGVEPTPCEAMCASTAALDCANEATCISDYCMPTYDINPGASCTQLLDAFFTCWANLPANQSSCDGDLGYPVTDGCSAESDAAAKGGCFG
ncbi:MAG TPA: hypothetical protein VFZ53_19675 [Polyangiaceae bacterium]